MRDPRVKHEVYINVLQMLDQSVSCLIHLICIVKYNDFYFGLIKLSFQFSSFF